MNLTSVVSGIYEAAQMFLPVVICSWALFLVFTLKWPQKFFNSFILMWCLFITAFMLLCMFGENRGIAMVIAFLVVVLGLLLVPFLLMYNGIRMIRKESRSLGNLLSLLLGFVILAGEAACMVFTLQGALSEKHPILMFIAWLFGNSVFYISCIILAFVIYILFIQFMPYRKRFDYVVIHGCGLIRGERVSKLLSNRVDKAIEIYNKCDIKPILIPSGGQGPDEKLSEAEAMKQYMLSKGIPEDHILMEDQSKTTLENLRNSKKLIEERSGNKVRTALVSSNYHVYRCLIYAKRMKWDCIGVGAKVAWYYWPSATLREFVAVFSKKPHIIWTITGYVFFVILPAWAIWIALL